MAYLYLILAFTLNSIANILLKLGAVRGLSLSGGPLAVVEANWQLLLGLVIFATNIIFYFLALRALPISVAYPVMVVMGFLIVNSYALLALHEPITAMQYIGYIFIVFGLTLVVAQV